MEHNIQEETPEQLVEQLVQLLNMECIDDDLYRGPITNEPWLRVFGGQVVGQALMAACQTVEGKMPHSLHAYFMRPGDAKKPIIFEVFRDRDGKSFASRRVVAKQNGKPILNLSCSFQLTESGFSHQFEMPDVPPPDNLKNELEQAIEFINTPGSRGANYPQWRKDHMLRPRPIEFRPVNQSRFENLVKTEPRQYFWFKAIAPIPNNQILNRILLTYASDMMFLTTSMLPHGVSWDFEEMQDASLDHAVWFHDDVNLNEWLLYAMDSPWTGQARGMNRGLIYTQSGKLVASIAQECLIRWHGKLP